MLLCFNPKHLVVVTLLLAATTLRVPAAQAAPGATGARGNTASGAGSGAASSAPLSTSDDITVTGFNFTSPLQDQYSKSTWMVAEVDFTGKAAGTGKWIDSVDATLTLGWGTTSPKAEIDLAITATIHLLAIESGKREVVFFLVPPEVLARGSKNQAYGANVAPTFYAVQFKAGGSAISTEYRKSEVSDRTLPNKEYVDAFVAKGVANQLMSEATVPPYVLYSLLGGGRVGGNSFPTFLQNSDSGH
jgi:hypothetical protein